MKWNDWPKGFLLLVCTCSFFLSSVAGMMKVYDITYYGAIGDGLTDNTRSIQDAIDACSKTGGEVYVPAGVFLTSTLMLKSNVTLNITGGATILAQKSIEKYPEMEAGFRFYGDQWAKYSLIFCKGMQNVAIKGEGVIDGQGASFPASDNEMERYSRRPFLLWFIDCRNISVSNIELRNSAFWMQYYLLCENVYISGLRIWNHSNKNNDMLDIDGCKNVVISDITGDSDDDGITIKSTSPAISENIVISNCIISSHCNAIKFGTESTGGFRRVIISNCIIKPSKQRTVIYGKPDGISGIALEVVDGGVMEDINIHNIVMEGPQVPIFARLGNRARKYIAEAGTPPVGKMKNVTISNVFATGADATGCSLTGIEKMPIENVTIRDVSIEVNGSNLPDSLYDVRNKDTDYPEATMFGILPSYGFYISYATGLTILDITTRYKGMEGRPGVIIANTVGFMADGLNIQSSGNTKVQVYILNSRNGSLKDFRSAYSPGKLFFKDKYSRNIRFIR